MTEGKGFVARRQERESAKALKKLIKQVEDDKIFEIGGNKAN
jgi:hypothetical protein